MDCFVASRFAMTVVMALLSQDESHQPARTTVLR
jgi:hypothetical protein